MTPMVLCGDDSDTITNEIPTTTLENGNEATVIAGAVNPHLNVRKAMGCIIARSYFVKAFTQLSDADKKAFVENDMLDLGIIVSKVLQDFESFFGGLAYSSMGADSEDAAATFITYVHDFVSSKIGNTDEADIEFGHTLETHYNEKWRAQVNADKEADRQSKSNSK